MQSNNFITWFTQRPAFMVSGLYALVAGIWILASDTVLTWLVRDPAVVSRMQTYKGWFFVAVTAFLLFVLVRQLFQSNLTLTHELESSEKLFRTTFEQVPVGRCHLDETGRFLTANNMLCQTLGYDSPEDLLAMTLPALMHPDGAVHTMQDLLPDADLSATAPNHEVRLRHRTGSYQWCQITLATITLPMGDNTISGVVENIHDRKVAQELLHQSEQRFHTFFDSALIGMAMSSIDNRWLAVNDRFCTMMGYTREEMIDQSWVDITHPDDVDRNVDLFNRLITNQQDSYTLEKRFIRKDGAIIYTMLSANAIRHQDGTLNHIVTLIEDVTERKQVEQNLANSEAQYRQLIEQSPIPIVIHHEGKIVFLSDAAITALGGSSAEDFLDHNLLDFVAPEDHEYATVRIQRVHTHQEEDPQLEFKFIRLDGSPIDVYLVGTPVNYMGKPSAQVIFQDITARKRDEAELRRYAARLAALREIDQVILKAESAEEIAASVLEQVPKLLTCQFAGVIVYDFPGSRAVVLATHSAIDRPFIMPPTIPLVDMAILDQFWDGESFCMTDIASIDPAPRAFEHLRQQGVVSYIVTPLLVQGQLLGALYITRATAGEFSDEEVAISRDLGDMLAVAIQQANLYAQIQQYALDLEQSVADRTRDLLEANSRLQELDHLKSKFVSDVSHELRAPITNLGMYLHLLENSKPEKREDYLNVLKLQVKRLTNLVESILDLTRLELGTRQPTMRGIDFNLIIDQIIVAHIPRTEAAGLTLHAALDPDLPLVWGEQNQLAQVVANLLGNAINYTPAGQITIRTFPQLEQRRVCFQVEDTGLGIPEEELSHIFERFYRGDQPATLDIPGTGLGLGIVQEIVRMHQGSITVDSTLGEGSTFTVTLPIAAEQES